MRISAIILTVGLLASSAGCATSSTTNAGSPASASRQPEGMSLLGKPLYPRVVTGEALERLNRNLEVAQKAYDRAPANADSTIWLGRRLAYLERYRDAIRVFSDGVAKHPDDSRMYRHRAHRYISLRQFAPAIRDLERAKELIRGKVDEVEQDGAPNSRNIPTSTAHGNIYYHLALAYYLTGEYSKALTEWDNALRISTNDDTRVAVADWRYMTLRRLGQDANALASLESITKDLNVIENTAYHRRLLMYKGELPPESLLDPTTASELHYVTQGYGVANWYLAAGDTARARQIFDQMLAVSYWAAFGYIAAEVDVAKMRKQ